MRGPSVSAAQLQSFLCLEFQYGYPEKDLFFGNFNADNPRNQWTWEGQKRKNPQNFFSQSFEKKSTSTEGGSSQLVLLKEILSFSDPLQQGLVTIGNCW